MGDKKGVWSNYLRGVKNGIPICLGYLPIAFAFGITVVNKSFPSILGFIMSMTNFTATAQLVALDAIVSSVAFMGVAFRVFVVNVRYVLVAMSFSQRLNPNLSTFKKSILAFFLVDEAFAIAVQEKGYISGKYYMGLVTTPYLVWGIGTYAGLAIGDILPDSLSRAFGIVLYAMFAAILIPSSKKSRPIAFTVILSIVIDCLLQVIPVVKNWQENILIIIAAGIASCITAFKYPVDVDDDNNDENMKSNQESIDLEKDNKLLLESSDIIKEEEMV